MAGSFDLVNFSAVYVSRYLLALVRVLAALSLNPVLGSMRVPLPARIGLGLFLTLVLFPPEHPGTLPAEVGPLQVAGELLIGLLAGFAVAVIFAATQLAGNLISSNTGFNLAGAIDPHFDVGAGGMERLFSSMALTAFLAIDGHHLFLAGLNELFQLVDVGAFTLASTSADRLALLTAGLFSSALKMALPVLAALLLTDLGLAILVRVAPQFNLFALGLPLKMAVGLTAFFLTLPAILPRLLAILRSIPGGMLGLAG